jgi:hypothetical protein
VERNGRIGGPGPPKKKKNQKKNSVSSHLCPTHGRRQIVMGDRYSLCRLLSSIDDDPSLDETTFFEWARKTSSFSELSSAYGALRFVTLSIAFDSLPWLFFILICGIVN